MKNKKLVLAFQLAREEIRTGREEYICFALRDLYYQSKIGAAAYFCAVRIITKRLGDCDITVRTWLYRNVPEFQSWVDNVNNKNTVIRELRDYRLRWLDSLIEKFS